MLDNKINVQGHRGCRGLMPENTLPAFKKAIILGVQTLELDIAVSKDRKIVVSHEPFMSRTICRKPDLSDILETEDKKFNLFQMTYEEIKSFDCGTKYHERFPEQLKLKTYKPTLDAVFKMADAINPDILYNIEIKYKPEYDGIFTPNPEEFVALVLSVLLKHNVLHRSNLQSFDLCVLEAIKKQSPNINVALLVDEDESITTKLKSLSYTPEIISPYYKLLDKTLVDYHKKEGYKVIPWTVNTQDEMKQMIAYNVDGIITDYPNILLEIL